MNSLKSNRTLGIRDAQKLPCVWQYPEGVIGSLHIKEGDVKCSPVNHFTQSI